MTMGAKERGGGDGSYRGSNRAWGPCRGSGGEDRRWSRAAFVGGSGGVRLGASGPGGSTRWDLAVLGDGTARPERHRQRRFAASSAPAELGETAALGCCGLCGRIG